ncbi:MAG: hypothetical protein RBS40_05300 [Rhodocyclaceae bacterium]|jgi:hypothetical protein|nr:hypothetical protein [Rhodocyclaceae bacterium]
MKAALGYTAAVLAALLTIPALAQETEPYRFALMGDTPYTRFERTHLPAMLAEMEAAGAAFILHVGDIKASSERCDDQVLEDRRQLFDGQPLPFVLTPGDNEWVDCSRPAAGRFDPEERLAWLRRHFYPAGHSLGRQTMTVESQGDTAQFPEFRENLRWRRGPLLFATLHITGSGNNRGREATPTPEFLRREAANRAWLAEAFRQARDDALPALVLALQANPGLEDLAEGRPSAGYASFLRQLQDELARYPGEVVLVHGDTHAHRIDHPLRDPASGEPLARFTRIETHGSPFMGWVLVKVQPGSPRLLRFESRTYAPPSPQP